MHVHTRYPYTVCSSTIGRGIHYIIYGCTALSPLSPIYLNYTNTYTCQVAMDKQMFVSIQPIIWLEALNTHVSSSRCHYNNWGMLHCAQGNIIKDPDRMWFKRCTGIVCHFLGISWISFKAKRVGYIFCCPQKIQCILYISCAFQEQKITVRAMGYLWGGRSVLHCLLYHTQQATSR